MSKTSALIATTIPTFIGIGLAWLGTSLIKNEKKLIMRRLELEEALETKSTKLRKKLILGN